MPIRPTHFSGFALRKTAYIAGAIVTVAGLAACGSDQPGPTGVTSPPDLSSAQAPASAIWQETARSLVAQASLTPLAAARAYGFVGVGQYLAVQRSDASLNDLGISNNEAARRSQVNRGAVAGVSVVVLRYLFPAKVEALEEMVKEQGTGMARGSDQMARDFSEGERIGRVLGAGIVTRATSDHFDDANTAVPPDGDGFWTSSAIPALAVSGGSEPGVTRWFITSAKQFRPAAPPAFGSPDFNSALAEIRRMSDTRTSAQAEIAARWAMNPGTATAPGFWLDVASQEIVKRGVSERVAAHVFALLSATMADAVIGCWDAKLTYWLIRPWKADEGITTLAAVGKPNHPSYPSGHSCVSSSAAEVLGTVFADKRAEFDAMAAEAGLSRMYAGIHYRFDIDAGAALGRSVARFAIAADATGSSVLTDR
ncbi:MAG TPA: vanadium-dependent haloperoxidase [Gemmatimonadaceae bacterium]|nr:vanadium-dependent haloperoxidase [Gemmatimonadaceae bacterium]